MKLIEKKCPNCGASLEFSETAKSCKCDYCHRTFEVERDTKIDVSDIAKQFNLSELEKGLSQLEEPAKAMGKAFIIIFSLIFIFIVSVVVLSFHGMSNNKDVFGEEKDNKVIASNIKNIDNSSLKLLESEASSFNDVKGENSTKYSYKVEDNEMYKYILAYKDKKNYVFIVQKVLYINFFNNDDKKYVYVPVKYENVYSKLDRFEDSTENIIDGSKVDAPEFYLNDEKTSYIRGGYADYNQFIEEKINTLKNDGYKISEK